MEAFIMSTNNEKANEIKTSHYLFDTAPLLIRPELAVRIGLNEAIVMQQIHYWLENKRKSVKEKDREKDRTFHNGRFWTYDSYKEWQKQFPFWSERTVERIFTSLEEKKILLSDNFNEWKADRTKWYSIDYEALDAYEGKKPKKKPSKKEEKIEPEQSDNLAESVVEQSAKLAESGVEHSDNLAGGIRQLGGSIPTTCGEESDNLGSAIPKSSSKISSENSDIEFLNSSSLTENTSYIEEHPLTEEEEKKIKQSFMILGSELSKSEIMRTSRHINAVIQMMADRKVFVFDEVDIQRAILHYKSECEKRGKIFTPIDFFVKGFEMKLDERYSSTIGSQERKRREAHQNRLSRQWSGSLPFYNWLED